MNGFRINERTDQMRRERIAHQQSNQQNSTRLISKFTTTGVNLGKKLWISCPLSWEFSIPVLAGLIPRERFHRRKKGRCFHQKHCPEISSLSPKFTPCLKTHWEKLSRLAKLIRPSTERK